MRSVRLLGILLALVVAAGLAISPLGRAALAEEKEEAQEQVGQQEEVRQPEMVTLEGVVVDTEEGIGIDNGGQVHVVVGAELDDYVGAKVRATGTIEENEAFKLPTIFVEEYEILQ